MGHKWDGKGGKIWSGNGIKREITGQIELGRIWTEKGQSWDMNGTEKMS